MGDKSSTPSSGSKSSTLSSGSSGSGSGLVPPRPLPAGVTASEDQLVTTGLHDHAVFMLKAPVGKAPEYIGGRRCRLAGCLNRMLRSCYVCVTCDWECCTKCFGDPAGAKRRALASVLTKTTKHTDTAAASATASTSTTGESKGERSSDGDGDGDGEGDEVNPLELMQAQADERHEQLAEEMRQLKEMIVALAAPGGGGGRGGGAANISPKKEPPFSIRALMRAVGGVPAKKAPGSAAAAAAAKAAAAAAQDAKRAAAADAVRAATRHYNALLAGRADDSNLEHDVEGDDDDDDDDSPPAVLDHRERAAPETIRLLKGKSFSDYVTKKDWGTTWRTNDAHLLGAALDDMVSEGLDPSTSNAIERVVRKLHQLEFQANGWDGDAIELHAWGGTALSSIVPRGQTMATLKMASLKSKVLDKGKKVAGAGGGGRGGRGGKFSGKRAGGSKSSKPAGAPAK